jgi:transposase
MKVLRSHKKITPHGGIVPILQQLKRCRIPQTIRKTLGTRKAQSKYGYEDIFIAWVLTALCGGTRLDHITKLKKKLAILPDLKIPSHDTLGRVMKALATENSFKENVKGRGAKLGIHLNQFNENELMNRMLIKVSKQIGALEEGKAYTLHIDATFIETNCVTAQFENGAKKYGFYPMICLIDDMPVYISMRNGNINASFQLKECLEQCINALAENNIRVNKVISDSAGYSKAVIDMLYEKGIKFNIHMPMNSFFKTMLRGIDNCDNWEKISLKGPTHIRECEVGEINYTMLGSPNESRIIIARTLNKKAKEQEESEDDREWRKRIEQQMNELSKRNLLKSNNRGYQLGEWKEYKKYKVKLIITSDRAKTPEELILEYNKRGNAERQFDAMKNDFGWRLPPFMKMNENTVFMIAAALANNIFRGIVRTFKKDIPQLRLNARLREFIFTFIDVVCAYVNGKYEFYNTDIAFEKIV